MSDNLINREEFRKHYCRINCGERQCVDHADRCSFIDELMQFKTTEPDCLTCKQYEDGYMYGLNIGYNKAKSEFKRSEGEWKFVADDKANLRFIYKCSECGREVSVYDASTVINIYPFCHCGAKMKVGTK